MHVPRSMTSPPTSHRSWPNCCAGVHSGDVVRRAHQDFRRGRSVCWTRRLRTRAHEDITQLTALQTLFANAFQQRRIGGPLAKVNGSCDISKQRRAIRAGLKGPAHRLPTWWSRRVSACLVCFDVGTLLERQPCAQWGLSKAIWRLSHHMDRPSVVVGYGRGDPDQSPHSAAHRQDEDYLPWRTDAAARYQSTAAIPWLRDDCWGSRVADVAWRSALSRSKPATVRLLPRLGIVSLRTQIRLESARPTQRRVRSKEELVRFISHEIALL